LGSKKAIDELGNRDVLVVAEWDRATRSMLDGVHIIERIHARGALIKVLDKPHLDLTTPVGRGFIAFLSAEDREAGKRWQEGRQSPRGPIWTETQARQPSAGRSPQAPPGRRERPSIGQVLQGASRDHIEAAVDELACLSAAVFGCQADGRGVQPCQPIPDGGGGTGMSCRIVISNGHHWPQDMHSTETGDWLSYTRFAAL